MKKYEVIPIAVSGKNNKIYYAGDSVTADCFAAPVEQLVKSGFLKELTEEKPVKPEMELENKTPAPPVITTKPEKNAPAKPSKK